MRKVAMVVIIAAVPAFAGFGSVVSSFRKTDNVTSRGLAWAGRPEAVKAASRFRDYMCG